MTLVVFWSYVKKYWQLGLLVIGAVVGMILLRQRSTSFVDDYNKLQEAHQKELDQIQKACDQEREQLEANQQKLQQALDVIQKQYAEQQKELDSKKQSEIEQIVKEHGDDPAALAQKLSEATGFTVILPKDP